VARERIRHGGKQREPRRARRRLAEHYEGIAREHLAVEDSRAIEAGRLDRLEQPHEIGHRRRAGNAQMDADGFGHRAPWYT